MNKNVTLWINDDEPDIIMKRNNVKEQIELLLNKRKHHLNIANIRPQYNLNNSLLRYMAFIINHLNMKLVNYLKESLGV